MLPEIELFVTGGGPEILSQIDLIILLGIAFFVYKQQALAFPERRIGQDHGVFLVPRCGETIVPGMHNDLVAANTMQVEVHGAHAPHLG